MAVIYTSAKSTLAEIATTLAAEAVVSGQTSLSLALTSLSSEITSQSITEAEFFGGQEIISTVTYIRGSAANIWTSILQSAADAIASKSNNIISANSTTIDNHLNIVANEITTIDNHMNIVANEITTIDNHLNRIQSTVDDIVTDETEDQGSDTRFTSGPHFRNIATGWYTGAGTPDDSRLIARAMMMINLKETNNLQALRSEITNPTPLI